MEDINAGPDWIGDTNLNSSEWRYIKEVYVSAENYYQMMKEIRLVIKPSLANHRESVKLKSYAEIIEENFKIATKLRNWSEGNNTLARFPLNHDEFLTAIDLTIAGKSKCALMKDRYLDISRRTSLLTASQSHENPIDFAQKSVDNLYLFLFKGMGAVDFDTGEISQGLLDKIAY